MFVHLSHVIDPADGAFPGEPIPVVKEDSVRSETQPFNSYIIELPNHVATHMDGPRHFNDTGINFDELGIEKFAFLGEEILLVDLPHRNKPGEVIVKEDLEPYAEELRGKRLLLMRTGYEENKKGNPKLYEEQGLAIHPGLSRWLNEEFPELDTIGMDWLSVASALYDFGPEAHHWLLGNHTDHVITAVEDMHLAPIGDRKIKLITMGPLRIKGVDSAPVSIMAWLED